MLICLGHWRDTEQPVMSASDAVSCDVMGTSGAACAASVGAGGEGFTCQQMGDTAYTITTGTSFAAPQVAGAAAMWLGGAACGPLTYTRTPF